MTLEAIISQLRVQPIELTEATPVEIDTDLFTLMRDRFSVEDHRQQALYDLHTHLDKKVYRTQWRASDWSWGKTNFEVIERAREIAREGKQQRFELSVVEILQRYDAAKEDIKALDELRQPYEAEFNRRSGWTRAFLVDNADGHVHSSMGCSTCRSTTRFHWVTELSGHSEQEIVEQAGERACTVCYPSAPVDVLKRPSRIEGPAQQAAREAKEQRDEEKRQRDAAKAEKAIANPDGTPLRSRRGVINTVASAWQLVVSNVVDEVAYNWERRQDENIRIIAALAAKLGQTEDEVKDAVRTKAVAKLKRDGYGHHADRITNYSF